MNLLLLCSCAAGPSARAALPADVPINQDAGRGNWLIVTVQLENGRKLPLILDTGAGGTGLDKSLAPKLGKPLGAIVLSYWDKNITNVVLFAKHSRAVRFIPILVRVSHSVLKRR